MDMDENRENIDPNAPSVEDQRLYNKLIVQAKGCTQQGKILEALTLNEKALKIYSTDKLLKRIKKMKDYLKSSDDEDEDVDDGMIEVGDGFFLYRDLYDKLYEHQKISVLWFWGLHKRKKGGVLGDDMGLGKTIQVIAFLSGMFDAQEIKAVLIVMPVSLITNWQKEFSKWAPGIRVEVFHGTSKKEREKSLEKVLHKGGVLLTTYGMVVSNHETLSRPGRREFVWDYVILDEGHKIKNPTKTSKSVHGIPARSRFILTGTPIQNNLKELWALYDWVHCGQLLGTAKTFKMEFENPITRAREKDATSGEGRLGMEIAESLKRIIAPYFLRRTKADVTESKSKDYGKEADSESRKKLTMPSLTRKNDLIVWLFLSDTQEKIYQDFLQLNSVKELLNTSKSPLVALTVLKKICDHPRLLSTLACKQLGLHHDQRIGDIEDEYALSKECAANRINDIPSHILIEESGKLGFITKLMERLREEGHRCLIFSQSRKMLDMLDKILNEKGHKLIRLDGTISSTAERESIVKKFQRDQSINVMLLTTQVGGVGLTLTGADRVIIIDPSWNPATDNQAVDRVFRIGQDKNVVIYRLITCGTVEEKIYRRQVFKDSLTRQTTGNSKNPYRYFTSQELRELFTLDDAKFSSTQQQLEELHGSSRKTDPELDEHLAYLYSLDMFGLTDHDLMFSTQETQENDEEHNDYVQHRVQAAQQRLAQEASAATGSYMLFDGARPPASEKPDPRQTVLPMPSSIQSGTLSNDDQESSSYDSDNLSVQSSGDDQAELNQTLATLDISQKDTAKTPPKVVNMTLSNMRSSPIVIDSENEIQTNKVSNKRLETVEDRCVIDDDSDNMSSPVKFASKRPKRQVINDSDDDYNEEEYAAQLNKSAPEKEVFSEKHEVESEEKIWKFMNRSSVIASPIHSDIANDVEMVSPIATPAANIRLKMYSQDQEMRSPAAIKENRGPLAEFFDSMTTSNKVQGSSTKLNLGFEPNNTKIDHLNITSTDAQLDEDSVGETPNANMPESNVRNSLHSYQSDVSVDLDFHDSGISPAKHMKTSINGKNLIHEGEDIVDDEDEDFIKRNEDESANIEDGSADESKVENSEEDASNVQDTDESNDLEVDEGGKSEDEDGELDDEEGKSDDEEGGSGEEVSELDDEEGDGEEEDYSGDEEASDDDDDDDDGEDEVVTAEMLKQQYKHFKERGKQLYVEKDYKGAFTCVLKALKIKRDDPKLILIAKSLKKLSEESAD